MTGQAFVDVHNTLAGMQGYEPFAGLPWHYQPMGGGEAVVPYKFYGVRLHGDHQFHACDTCRIEHCAVCIECETDRRVGALRQAFYTVRREVWAERESRLRATWESYG